MGSRDDRARRFAAARLLLRRAREGLSPGSGSGRRRLAAVGLLLVVVVVVVVVGPGLSSDALTEWSARTGWWFPALFIVVQAVICVAPFPRTVFTVAAGVLFAPLAGIALAVAGTLLSALLTFLAGRALGRESVARRLTHPAVRAVDDRLRRRGWLAVGSLRMIPVVPFSVLNYCCSVSAIRLAPYLMATAVGVLPGTVAVVYFGNAVSTGFDGASLAISGVAVLLGVCGLVVDVRLDRRRDASSARTGTEPDLVGEKA